MLLKFISRSGYLFNNNDEFDYALWTCDDVNECKEGFDECSSDEFCQNTDGSYWCMCEDGFWLDPEGNAPNQRTRNMGAMRLEHFKGGNTTCSDYDECANGIYYYSEHNTNQLNNNFDSWPPQVRSGTNKVWIGSRSSVLKIISGLWFQ